MNLVSFANTDFGDGKNSENANIRGFSFSAISTFKSCPKSFELKYIQKLPEAFKSIEAYMGNCVHEVLEWAYQQRTDEQEPSLDAAVEKYKELWSSGDFRAIKVVKEDKTKEDYFYQGLEYIGYYFSTIFPEDQSETLYLEQRFQIPMTLDGEEIIYRGIIDRIDKQPDGTIRVTDYKTGKIGNPRDTLQLPSYALYIFLHNIDQQVELCIVDLKMKRTVVERFDRKEVKFVKEELLKEIAAIRATPQEKLEAKPSILCLWCGYNHICPAQQGHGQIITAALPKSNTPPYPGIQSNANATAGPEGEFQEGCPQCGGQLRERKGRFGAFMGCTNYPECRYTRDLGTSRANPAEDPTISGDEICPECGSRLKKRKGRYGEFFGCTSYPQCRFTRQF